MSTGTARLALLALLLHPFAFFLYGMAYAEALFLFLSLAAFTLLTLAEVAIDYVNRGITTLDEAMSIIMSE